MWNDEKKKKLNIFRQTTYSVDTMQLSVAVGNVTRVRMSVHGADDVLTVYIASAPNMCKQRARVHGCQRSALC